MHTAYANAYGNDLAWVSDLANGIPGSGFPGVQLNDSWRLQAVPEPATLTLVASGLAVAFRRRR